MAGVAHDYHDTYCRYRAAVPCHDEINGGVVNGMAFAMGLVMGGLLGAISTMVQSIF